MSKRTTTRWYIVAWTVWMIAFVAMVGMMRGGSSAPALTGGMLLGYLVLAVAGVVALLTWLGALSRLATQRAWSWFGALLVLQLFGLGIMGMVAYAMAGPEDTEIVTRPTAT